jgi:hypothetical protein
MKRIVIFCLLLALIIACVPTPQALLINAVDGSIIQAGY